jgi:hypothetical protein
MTQGRTLGGGRRVHTESSAEAERFGQSAEPGRQLLDQLELQLDELETKANPR